MKKQGKWILAILLVVAAAALFLIAGTGMLYDVIPFPGKQDFARPPCEKLPDKRSVDEAFVSHKDLVARLQNAGPGVKVEVATPCEGHPDRALIRILYKTKAEQEGISAILAQESFGVPVEPVRH
ncbi:conserved exported hypothetical protein [[Clostridium] ultunense Esp]|nr:conserved exported hypothetical protein [[Clostridium] ultunense Esp]